MRLHRLEISAFGPFAGDEAIDFDSLAEHGLFLLNGPTGAGKTSILDAVCFALYGSLPGARQGTRSLKSHHAPGDAEPAVVLEFTAQGRRFEVRRTPEWSRPSARSAAGWVQQKAATHVRELVDGAWRPLTSRNDEAGALLGGVLGMAREQFTRVVLLPQGEFASFLRAKASERTELLEKLFGTRRFAEVENQLASLAQAARTETEAAERAAARPVASLEAELAALAEELPDELARRVAGREGSEGQREDPEAGREESVAGREGSVGRREDPADGHEQGREQRPGRVLDPDQPLDPECAADVFAWSEATLSALRDRAASDCEAARAALADSRRAVTEATRAFEDARELAAARARRGDWEAAAATQSHRLEAIASHRAAALLSRPLTDAERASEAAARARADAAALAEATAATGWSPSRTDSRSGLPDAEEVRAAASSEEAEAAVLAERIAAERELADLERQLADAATALGAHRAAAERADADAERLSRELAALEEERARIAVDAAALGAATIEADAAEDIVKAVEDRALALRTLSDATREHEERRTQALDAKESWLGLRERRLGQAAAELAAHLDPDVPCPVCGSADHPAPAEGAEDPLLLVDAERAAARSSEAAAARERAALEAVAEARAQLAAVEARGGATDPDKAVRVREEKLAAVRHAREAEARLTSVFAQLRTLSDRRQSALAAREEATGLRIRAEETLRSRGEERDRRQADVVLWRGGFPSVSARQSDVAARARTLAALGDSLGACRAAQDALSQADAALSAALEASPFADAPTARAALLSPAQAARLEAEAAAHEAEGQQLSGLFASAAVQRALDAEHGSAAADGSALEAARTAESAAELRARTGEFAAQRTAAACGRLATLRAAFEGSRPLLEQTRGRASTLAELARTARGQGENARRMSLHSYVLAARLEQVAVAASERLLAMSDGRFSLEHTDALAARGAASGLGLDVVDGWTGQRRDPSTLSGGETFMASLALALGLADVVQHEAGGIDIETLFVDEGFGSLDEQALEQVMDAIEGLRAGGRVVGLVSHVSELKQRIPAQIRVSKGRDGSRIASVGLVPPTAHASQRAQASQTAQ
ncbi:SMC family ATPase [Sinomonas atrocyanea]|uniref:SMC family ATPase n=1 Tax=Sinomonas atrocyanea TaxID=37927 RepID=UPI00286252AD|nr:SMC family ATPase [Sinomonas atrocyanea]MDR6620530.1 exonuclease SbcC [Sinomonas atrocyanea]